VRRLGAAVVRRHVGHAALYRPVRRDGPTTGDPAALAASRALIRSMGRPPPVEHIDDARLLNCPLDREPRGSPP